MMMVTSSEELSRVLQFLDHLVQHSDICEVLLPDSGLGDCFTAVTLLHIVNRLTELLIRCLVRF